MDQGKSGHKTFPTTQWTLIDRATAGNPEDRSLALEEICAAYWTPVYAYIRARGYTPHDAEDLTQDFFAELLQRNDLAKVDACHGKLRSYLLTGVKNHLVSAHRWRTREKRGGNEVILSIDSVLAESRCLISETTSPSASELLFDRQWAIALMEGVLEALEKRYNQKGQSALFQALKPFIMPSSDQPASEALAQQLGMSDNTVRVAIHRFRQRYGELLRKAVKATLVEGANEDEEIRYLMTVFK